MALIMCMFISTCNSPNNRIILRETSIKNIRQQSLQEEKVICVLLYDSTQYSFRDYIDKIYDYDLQISSSVEFYSINVLNKKNDYYYKLFNNTRLPISIIIYKGKIIDIIPGVSYESLNYLSQVCELRRCEGAFHVEGKYYKEKLSFVDWYDKAISFLDFTNKRVNIDSLLDINYNLYLCYANMCDLLFKQDTILATDYARRIVEGIEVRDVLRFDNEFTKAYQIFDTNYNIKNGPYMSVPDSLVVKTQQSVKNMISLKIKNVGCSTLKIYDIIMSCDCMEVQEKFPLNVSVNEELHLNLTYTHNMQDSVERSIYIVSNSIGKKLACVKLHAYL